ALVIGVLLATTAGAADAPGAVRPLSGSDGTRAALREEMRDVLSRMVAAGALDPAATDESPLQVDAPADRVLTLGVVLDSAAANGLSVLAVTPGGNGETIGLRSGDRILNVNGVATSAHGAEALRNEIEIA